MGEDKKGEGRQNKVITVSVLKLETTQVASWSSTHIPPCASGRTHPSSPGFHRGATNTLPVRKWELESPETSGASQGGHPKCCLSTAERGSSARDISMQVTNHQSLGAARQGREPQAAMGKSPGQLKVHTVCPCHVLMSHGQHQWVSVLLRGKGWVFQRRERAELLR